MKNYDNSLDYSQYDKNNTLAFALSSMMFEPFTHIVVKRRTFDTGLQAVGGGTVYSVLSRFGSLKVIRSNITSEGVLLIVVE